MARQAGIRRLNPFSRLGELFDASAMGVVTLLLVGTSFFATWRGMRDFIIGNDLAAGLASQGLVVLVVLTLTLAMYVALRETVSPYETPGWWSHVWKRLVALPLYLLLAVWSVGFGYGFWWSVIAGESVTEAEISQVLTEAREEMIDMKAGLVAAASVMSTAERLSDEKAAIEASRGGTCGIASPPGDGPLARARSETQSQIAALSASVQGEWLPTVTARLDGLAAALGTVGDVGEGAERRAAYEQVYRDARAGARDISADATARGRGIAVQLRAKADQLAMPPESGTVAYCHDPDLATALRAAADELAGPFEISVPDFRFSEGAEGVARAVEDLWQGLFVRVGLTDEPATGRALNGRSLIALIAAIGIDLALLVFGVLRGGGSKGRQVRDTETRVYEAARPAIESSEPMAATERPAALPAPDDVRPVGLIPRKGRVETRPSNVGIGTMTPDSQASDDEQTDDLIASVEEIYNSLTPEQQLSEKDAEIARLNEELARLKRRGYVATGRPGQNFDQLLHKAERRVASDLPAGKIVAVISPGFYGPDGNIYRVARVIVSAGPSVIDYDT